MNARPRMMQAAGCSRRLGRAPTNTVLFLGFALAVAGCARLGKKAEAPSPIDTKLDQPIDSVRLGAEVRSCLEGSFANVVGTASTIAAATEDRRVREHTLRWKLRAQQAMNSVLAETDPRHAFIETWILATQSRRYLTEGEGKSNFGDQQPLAVDAVREFEARILRVGSDHFSAEKIEQSKAAIEHAASVVGRGALLGEGLGSGTVLESFAAKDMTRLLHIPLAPLSGMQGVADTPTAIENFTVVARSFVQFMQGVSQRTRWEIELILLEVQSMDTVVEMRKRVEELSTSFREATNSLNKLPDVIRDERIALMDAVEKSHPKFHETVLEIRKAADIWNASVKTADDVAAGIGKASQDLARAGAAWEAMANSTKLVIAEVDHLKGPPSGGVDAGGAEAAGEPFKIEDAIKLAETTTRTLAEARALLTDINDPIKGQGAVRYMAESTGEIANAFLWRGLILILAALAAGLVFHRLTRRRAA